MNYVKTKTFRSALLLLIGLISFQSMAHAGNGASGGVPGQRPMPDGDFKYDCTAAISVTKATVPGETPYELISTQKFTITNENVNASGGQINLPKAGWANGRQDFPNPNNHNPKIEPVTGEPPYPLDGHFVGVSFGPSDDGWSISLRANLVFKEAGTGAAAFSLASFADKKIAARLSMGNPEDPSEQIDFDVECSKNN